MSEIAMEAVLPPISRERSPVNNSHNELIKRAHRWANERFNFKKLKESFFQWRARKSIVHALEADVKHEKNPLKIKQSELNKRIGKFRMLQRKFSTSGPLSATAHDLLTGQEYFVIIRDNNNDDLIAEERRRPYDPAKSTDDLSDIVSQAVLSKDGSAKVTLNFTEPQYKAHDANPSVFKKGYARTALKTFDLLMSVVNKNKNKV